MSTVDPGTVPDGGADDLVDALAQTSFLVIGRLSRLAAEEDLSLTQLRMLAILRDRSARMADLAEALGVDRSSVTGLVSRAEQRGTVARVAEEGDGRGVRVRLTEEGAAFTRLLTEKSTVLLGDLTVGLGEGERQTLVRLLSAVIGRSG